MKENDMSRFTKWGIPGWTMLLAFLSFTAFDIILSPSSSKNSLVAVLGTALDLISKNSASSAAAALLVAAAGIPLGFMIYQVYFYIRWNSPFARDGLFPPFIVGRLDDIKRTINGIDSKDMIGKDQWRQDWIKDIHFESDHGVKWRYIENFFTEIVQYVDSRFNGLSIHARYRYLMDLMHTLGAGLFGIYLGFLAYLLLKVKTDDISLSMILSISVLCLFFLMFLLEMEDKAKKEKPLHRSTNKIFYLVVRPFKRITHFQLSNPSADYLLFLFSILYIGSPSPYTVAPSPYHIWFRSVLIAALVLAWLAPKFNYPRSIFISEVLILAFMESWAFILAWSANAWNQFQPEWWNIGWCILFFLTTNLIFIKNRQNTRDDLIAMQNYMMKRYFSSSIKPFSPPQQELKPKRKTPKLKKKRNNSRVR